MAAVSPPASPAGGMQRPVSVVMKSHRSSSRMSMSSRNGGSRASDEDTKTAVKVAIRIRPPLQPSEPGYDLIPQRFRGSACQVTSLTSLTVASAQGKKLFVFDRVFGEEVDQTGLWEYLSESVSSFIQGYNVSILAYGQSGSGKSYTMGTTGPREQADQRLMGVVPRAAMALFESLTGVSSNRIAGSGIKAPSRYSMQNLSALNTNSKTSADKSWQMKATYVEIYNEQLHDLLLPESVPAHERPQVSIREDTKGRIILTGLRQVNINSVEDLLNALNFGSSIRQTDSTAVNAKSSRSHAVFSLNLIQKKSKTASTPSREKRFSVPLEAMSGGSESWVTVDSKLHFVDLAGSERLKNTGAQGERAREGISINAGLASLGKVIAQLSSRSAGSHVSYRDSRLTRLLQDSLGGSAITYMVACVNPAEFHLSETLNTVQYAQRARAIQSKPQIQQVSDESDKQAVIDRLRAEVSFLRDQIRLSERTERKRNAPQESLERKQEREVELQNQLLDVQENYNALSHRHAKLMSDLTKSKYKDGEDPSSLKGAIGESAFDRLKRSNSFAEAVEQVVLEYEKTIQSLEASLSTTRSSLASSESTLMERETKIAYMDTVTQQLQARITKAVDREANNENYLRDLEAKVEGVTNGEEKSASLIHDLRKELTRVRESEASCEEYISTLEERLAEAEQDHDNMQQEIDRLELVVERQRSIGKLDRLINDLDHMRQPNGQNVESEQTANGRSRAGSSQSESSSEASASVQNHTHRETFFEADEEIDSEASSVKTLDREKENKNRNLQPNGIVSIKSQHEKAQLNGEQQNPAQSNFVADKLDSVTQELFDLRVEHESTVNEYEELKRKHEAALNTLSDLQDSVEEARDAAPVEPLSPASTRPTSFLGDAGVNGLREDGQPSSSRTLSSELSLAGDSSEAADSSDVDSVTTRSVSTTMHKNLLRPSGQLNREIEKLRLLNEEKEISMSQLTQDYTQLQEKHQDTLDYVEELKTEIQKAQMASSSSSPTQQVIRRKSSQVAMTVDRANRSAASLRNIALEQFEDEPDLFQNFDLNLSGLMTELHMRAERCQALETELAAVRKEMEVKVTMISGLTRERSSLKVGAPVDMSVVSMMSDQLKESENKIRSMQQDHASRERELTNQVQSLKVLLAETGPGRNEVDPDKSRAIQEDDDEDSDRSPKTLVNSVAGGALFTKGASNEKDEPEEVSQLQREIVEWKTKHRFAMEAVKGSEEQLSAIVKDLENRLKEAETAHAEEMTALQEKLDSNADSDSETSSESSEQRIIELEKEIEKHKAAAAASEIGLVEMQKSYDNLVKQIDDNINARRLSEKEVQTHKGLVANLEDQLSEQHAALEKHQEIIRSLKEAHAEEVRKLKNANTAAQRQAEEQHAQQSKDLKTKISQLQRDLLQAQARHEEVSSTLHMQAEKTKADLANLVKTISAAAGINGDVDSLKAHIRTLHNERQELSDKYEKASVTLQSQQEQLKVVQARSKELEGTVDELTTINTDTLKELEKVREMERKSSRLVEELEDQLSSNYDQQQAATNNYSALQGEHQVRLQDTLRAKAELEKALEESRTKISSYEAQLDTHKANRDSLDPRDTNYAANGAGVRRSTSQNSLPSPPPAIPLPPLPPGSPQPSLQTSLGSAMTANNNNNAANTANSPTTSRHQSKDVAQTQLVEDQEARIRTIEKHLYAEKQLTATLEEALGDVETTNMKTKAEMEAWRSKCEGLEEELSMAKKERDSQRHSLLAEKEEHEQRLKHEIARVRMEEQMNLLQKGGGKKKKSVLNCF